MINWYTYMVRCNDGSLYTGITNNLIGRVKAHNSGRGAKYTNAHRPVSLVWIKSFSYKSEALKEEARIKSCTKSEKELIVKS